MVGRSVAEGGWGGEKTRSGKILVLSQMRKNVFKISSFCPLQEDLAEAPKEDHCPGPHIKRSRNESKARSINMSRSGPNNLA